MKPERRKDLPAAVTRTSIKCLLTNKVYRWNEYDTQGKEAAFDQHEAEAGPIVDANNARLGRRLRLSEHISIMSGKFDPRTEREKVLARVDTEAIESRDNREPYEGNEIRNAMAGVDPSHKFWASPARQEALRRIDDLASREDSIKELEAAKEAVRSDPLYANAIENADVTLRILANNPDSNPTDIAAAKHRRDALANFQITVADYWKAARETEERPVEREADLQREADGQKLADQLRRLKDNDA